MFFKGEFLKGTYPALPDFRPGRFGKSADSREMDKLFEDILNMDGVHGLVLLSEAGKVLFESLDNKRFLPEKSTLSWKMIIDSLEEFNEMDLVFAEGRFYMIKTGSGFLLISMSLNVSTAMVKLNCDILIPELKKALTGRGFKRFFKF